MIATSRAIVLWTESAIPDYLEPGYPGAFYYLHDDRRADPEIRAAAHFGTGLSCPQSTSADRGGQFSIIAPPRMALKARSGRAIR